MMRMLEWTLPDADRGAPYLHFCAGINYIYNIYKTTAENNNPNKLLSYSLYDFSYYE